MFAAGPGGNLSGEVSVMSEHGGKSVVGEVADNLALGCGGIVGPDGLPLPDVQVEMVRD